MRNAQSTQGPQGADPNDTPGYEQTPEPQAEPGALRRLTADDMETVALHLMELRFGDEGLTRDQIRDQYRDLPEEVYLRLPASRHYLDAEEVLRDAGDSRSRAEGDFLGPHPDIPERASMEDGGPPAWGGTPLFTIDAVEDGGSAEDILDRESPDETTR